MPLQLTTALAAAFVLSGQEPEPIREFCPLYFVFFEPGSARLSATTKAVIDDWVGFTRVLEAPRNRYVIQVATEPTGSSTGNRQVSWRRGRAIMRYMVNRGLPPDRFAIRVTAPEDQFRTTPGATPDRARLERQVAVLILATTLSNMRRHDDSIC